jgi:hypothetical protein
MFIKSKYYCFIIIFMSIIVGGCYNKTNLEVDKQKTARETASKTQKPPYELSVDTLQYEQCVYGIDEEDNPVQGRVSIEGSGGYGILRVTNSRTVEVVLDKGKQNKIIATDQEGFTYNLILQ